MRANDHAAEKGESESDQTAVRGEVKIVEEATVAVEDSNVGVTKLYVASEDYLGRITVDLSREDAERVRDELSSYLGDD